MKESYNEVLARHVGTWKLKIEIYLRADFNEQEKTFLFNPQVRVYINAPGDKDFDPGKPDGKPIQPVTNIHIDTYVDYSHGIRLINREIHVGGIPMHINDILDNPNLFRLISNEDEPIKKLYNSSHVQ